eukprot:TRINITY_DN1902_c0_g1_i6.p1 TRINITY_DN1902_c0_g1~~TRINITY_DN1902_c0_g1_i6.p1  ORF type:complete len:151 (+),score=38.38 TRINITY_DN1902_c0_g1_i6:73-525(+)
MCIRDSFNIGNHYTVGDKLGSGSFGLVSLGIRVSDNKEFAIKTISKKQLLKNPRSAVNIVNEIKVLRLVNHPKIMKLYEVYESNGQVHLVMEYIRNGDLMTHLKSKGTYNEKDASLLIMQALHILDYCHSMNIVHRDLKPENFVIEYATC